MEEVKLYEALSGAQFLCNDLRRARCGLDEYLVFDRNFIALLESVLERAVDYIEARECGY